MKIFSVILLIAGIGLLIANLALMGAGGNKGGMGMIRLITPVLIIVAAAIQLRRNR